MAQPSPPIPASDAMSVEDIDGASVMSRATLYSYASMAAPRHARDNRGYSTKPRNNNSNNARRSSDPSSHQPGHRDSHDYSCGNGSIASVGSGGSQNSRSRRNRRRSRSHDYFHGKDGGDDSNVYYRDRDRHPPNYNRGGGRYDNDRSRSSTRYDDDRSAGSPPRRHREDDASYGSYKSSGSRRRRRPRSEGSHREDERDYYRRPSSKSRARHGSPPTSPVKEEWPPCFDTAGSAFVFDNRSAMFYEALSDFFYDPKSKLYYGNRKGAYFRYDDTLDPPAFVEVQKMAQPSASGQDGSVQSTMDQVPIQTTTAPQKNAEAAKPKIAIKLKTKKIKSSSTSAPSPPTTKENVPTILKGPKAQIANIQKWTEKQAELSQSSPSSSPPTILPSATANPAGDNKTPVIVRPIPVVADKGKVRMTAKGEPICLICKRKFPNMDKLRLHERASELHKKNLQKLQSQEEAAGGKRKSPETAQPAAAAEYQDRAQKRRQLHGPDTIPERRTTNMMLHNHTEPPAPAALDASHVGHQMLQKMGWKGNNDEAQGRQGNGDTANQLRKDWDRIEALAKNNNQRR